MGIRIKLRAFISSRMEELSYERDLIELALNELNIQAWKFESDAGARPETIQETYLRELRDSDFYIGIFWKGYGEYTIDEYAEACKIDIPCFIYEKRTELEERNPRLQAFLDEISSVTSGRTVQWFSSPEELSDYVKRDVSAWVATLSRKGWTADIKESQSKRRKTIRNRAITFVSILLILTFALISWFMESREQHCVQDQRISQNGQVHIFESHFEGENIRWWLQQNNDGFFSLGSTSKQDFPKEVLGSEFVLAVRYDSDRDYVWVGTSGNGLIRLVKRNDKWSFDRKFDVTSGLVDCQIQAIVIDKERIYLAPIDSRIPALSYSDDGETWLQTSKAYDAKGTRFHSFYSLVSDGNSIWAGTNRGLYRFDGVSWFGPYLPDWLDNQEGGSLLVHNIVVGAGNIKWLVTESNGLLLLATTNGKEIWLDPLSDLGIEKVYSLDLFSSGKKALIGAQRGLLMCNLQNLEPLEFDCEVIENEDTNQKTIYSLLIAPDDSLVLLGTDDNEYITMSSDSWEE